MENQDLMALQNKLLVATPLLSQDPLFANALIYLYDYQPKQGSVGIMINKATNLTLSDVVERLAMECDQEAMAKLRDIPILVGGPMSRKNALILRKERINRSNKQQNVGQYLENLTEAVLQDLITAGEPLDFEVVLGFTSWGCGLLEQEIVKGYWLLQDVDQQVLFEIQHEQRYAKIIEHLGIDLSFYVSKDGHG